MAESELVEEHRHCCSHMWTEHAGIPKRYSEVQGEKDQLFGLGMWAPTAQELADQMGELQLLENVRARVC